jgi:hypothetical protein
MVETREQLPEKNKCWGAMSTYHSDM